MKNKLIFSILPVAIILSLMMLALPLSPALAQETPTISALPASGAIGDWVTVTGSGFNLYEGQWIHVFFHFTSVYSVQVIDGNFTAPFTVPTGTPFGTVAITVQRITNAYDTAFRIWTAPIYFVLIQQATIQINPTSGIMGQTVTVGGTSFAAGNNIDIAFDNVNRGTATANTSGAFSGATFTVPESYQGTHVVKATDASGNFDTESFTTNPSIAVVPSTGMAGDETTVNGTGFRVGKLVTFSYAGSLIYTTDPGSITPDDKGSFSASFSVPTSDRGSYDVEASDGIYEASASFTVEIPLTFSVDLTSGIIGTEFTVLGNGFAKDSNVEIFFSGDKIGEKVADSDGRFSGKFRVPVRAASGTHTIKISDGINIKSAEFTIPPHSASFSKTKGYSGTEVTISGTNFAANTPVIFTYDGEKEGETDTDANGTFSMVFTIPPAKKGTYKMEISDGIHTESAEFTIEADASIKPTRGHIGTEVTASGNGFTGEVTVKYDATNVPKVAAGDKGAFSSTFKVPVSKGGNHTVTISDSYNTYQFTFTMETDSPPVPKLILPESDIKAEAVPLFDWEDITDPSGVTYTFQLASDADFKSILIQKNAMRESEYTVTEEQALESTKEEAPYYWRVKATDGALNESAWSTPRSFHVGFEFSLPDWAKYSLMGLGALLVGLIGFLIGRRSAYSY